MLDDIEQRVVDDIAAYGWHLIGVSPGEHGPGFIYSIGMMFTLDHPEIIIFGLDQKIMQRIVNDIGKQIREGRSFAEPMLYEDVLANFACKIREVSAASHEGYLGYAMWHRRHIGKIGTLKAVQCLWPDKAGIFPDEPGCNPVIVRLQPLL